MYKVQQLNIEMQLINNSFDNLFLNKSYKDERLTTRHFSQLVNKIYLSMQQDDKSEIKVKDLLLKLYRTYLSNLLNMMAIKLMESQTDTDFILTLNQKWQKFKRFTFYYYALLQHANSYYQNVTRLNWNNKKYQQNIDSEESIYPIPSISLYMFRSKILSVNEFKIKIKNCLLECMRKQRKEMSINTGRESIQKIFQIIWNCGMGQVGRIRTTQKQQVIGFYLERNKQILQKVRVICGCQDYMEDYILHDLKQETQQYYYELFESKISSLGASQAIATIFEIIQLQEQISNIYLFTQLQKKRYMQVIYEQLINKHIEYHLYSPTGLKWMLQRYVDAGINFDKQQIFKHIEVYFKVLKKQENQIILKQINTMMEDVIMQRGNIINQKINIKHREHIKQIIQLKKNINYLLEQMMHKNIQYSFMRENCFKKLLEKIQIARNLSQYTDFMIRQCIRLKSDEDQCLLQFHDIFLILQNLSAQDSFLLYHQQFLSRRMLDTVNEPKIQIEIFLLKKIAESLGTIAVSSHINMIKDIENSLRLTTKYNNRMPFVSIKWTLRIYTSAYWPDSMNNHNFKIKVPNILQQYVPMIEELYHKDNNFHYLQWKLQRGISLFTGTFQNCTVRFQSENIYMIILLLIAQQPEYKILYGHLKQLVQQNTNQQQNKLLINYIKVLLDLKLINKFTQNSDQIDNGQQLWININYQKNIEINKNPNANIIIKPSQQIQKLFKRSNIEQNKIIKDRQKLIQAVLIKQLKHSHATGNNKISLQYLIKAIENHHYLSRMKFSHNLIKQKLEQLIARQYCIRDQNDPKLYHYIA